MALDKQQYEMLDGDWDGIAYVDPLAVGANPTAKIYPDGSIVGSTDNGGYTRWPNGDLECSVQGTTTTGVSTGVGSLFNGPLQSTTFPVAFVGEMPVTSVQAGVDGSYAYAVPEYNSTTTLTYVRGLLWSPVTESGLTYNFAKQAKGRWKA